VLVGCQVNSIVWTTKVFGGSFFGIYSFCPLTIVCW
jgi:hypothetical protein